MASHGQVMLSLFKDSFPSCRTARAALGRAGNGSFRIQPAAHFENAAGTGGAEEIPRGLRHPFAVLIEAPETYVIDLDRHINRNVVASDLGVEGASTIQ